MTQGIMPNQVIFKLNDDNTTYSVDCIYDSIKVNGELYPCKPDIFEKTYELVGD